MSDGHDWKADWSEDNAWIKFGVARPWDCQRCGTVGWSRDKNPPKIKKSTVSGLTHCDEILLRELHEA